LRRKGQGGRKPGSTARAPVLVPGKESRQVARGKKEVTENVIHHTRTGKSPN